MYTYLKFIVFSLLVAIGIEAFNKFSQDEKEKLEENLELQLEEAEKIKEPKVTGRYLLRGIMGMIVDTFEATNELVRLI